MRPRFCPKCGARNIEGELCAECSQYSHPLGQLAVGQLELCAHCRKYKRRNTWIPFKGLREVLRETIGRSAGKNYDGVHQLLVPEHELRKLMAASQSPKPGLRLDVQVGIKAPDLKMPRIVTVPVLFTACGHCSRHGSYFEGILQVRNAQEGVLAYIKKHIGRGKKKGVRISGECAVHNGVDFYITSQAFLRKIGTLLHKKFGGVVKSSVRIFTLDKQTSRDVYRLNVYFEPMPLHEGDAFILDGALMKLLRRGKQPVYFDFEKNASVSTSSRRLMGAEKILPQATTVIKTRPACEVMDPDTYQPAPISNQRLGGRQLGIGKKVKIVKHNGRVWVV